MITAYNFLFKNIAGETTTDNQLVIYIFLNGIDRMQRGKEITNDRFMITKYNFNCLLSLYVTKTFYLCKLFLTDHKLQVIFNTLIHMNNISIIHLLFVKDYF